METEDSPCNSSFERRNNILATIQHFNTNAEDVTDFLFNIALEDFLSCIPTISKSMQEFFSHSDGLDEGIEKFVKRFYEKLERNSEILEKFLEEVIFHVSTKSSEKLSSHDSCETKIQENNKASCHEDKVNSLKERLAKLIKEKRELTLRNKELDFLNSKLNLFKTKLNQNLHSLPKSDVFSIVEELSTVSKKITSTSSNV